MSALGLPDWVLVPGLILLAWLWKEPAHHVLILGVYSTLVDIALFLIVPDIWQKTTIPVIIYTQLVALVLALRRGMTPLRRPVLFISFFGVAYALVFALSAYLNQADIKRSLQVFQAEVRFVPLFLVLALVRLRLSEKRTLVKAFLVVAGIQILIGSLSLLMGDQIPLFGSLVERNVVQAETRGRGITISFLPGHFTTALGGKNQQGVFFAFTLVLVFALKHLYPPGGFSRLVLFWLKVGLIVALVLSWSMIGIGAALLGWFLVRRPTNWYAATNHFMRARVKRWRRMLTIVLTCGLVLILTTYRLDISNAFFYGLGRILNPVGFLQHAIRYEADRPALYFVTVPRLLGEIPIYGWGPDRWSVSAYYDSPEVKSFVKLRLAGSASISDSNYVAMLGQVGPLGMLFFLLMMGAVWRALVHERLYRFRHSDPLACALVAAACALIGVYLLIGLTNTFWITRMVILCWVVWGLALNRS